MTTGAGVLRWCGRSFAAVAQVVMEAAVGGQIHVGLQGIVGKVPLLGRHKEEAGAGG